MIKIEYAEKAVELARLYTRGEEVFGSMDKFKLWIKYPSLVEIEVPGNNIFNLQVEELPNKLEGYSATGCFKKNW